VHGRNLVGVTGDVCPPTFSAGEDIICHVPSPFSLRVCSWRVFKTKYDVCYVLCEKFFMLDVTHSNVDAETQFGVVSLILVFFINFYFKNDF